MSGEYRYDVINRLKELILNKDVAPFAAEHGITIIKDGKINKGWVGQTLDRVTKTKFPGAQSPDGPDFELKSVHVVLKDGEWVPKETIAITMFNPDSILTESFEDSALWHKIERLILVGHSYPEGKRDSAHIRFVAPVNVADPAFRSKIEGYWTMIRETVRSGNIASYSSKGTSTEFVQLRTKGSGTSERKCPITGILFKSRAFYATKVFIRYVRGN